MSMYTKLPGTFVPYDLRQALDKGELREDMYAIGTLAEDGTTFAGVYGPVPNIDDMLNTVPSSDGMVLMHFRSDGTEVALYTWSVSQGQWNINESVLRQQQAL